MKKKIDQFLSYFQCQTTFGSSCHLKFYIQPLHRNTSSSNLTSAALFSHCPSHHRS